jgi:hypothetical protein
MEHMILLLQPDDAQQEAVDRLVAQQHDPHSSQYHRFVTPGQYAAQVGASQNDIDKAGTSAAPGTHTLLIRTGAGGTVTETSLPLTVQ